MIFFIYAYIAEQNAGICSPNMILGDKYNYVVPDFVWEDIKKLIVDSLGIELKEKK